MLVHTLKCSPIHAGSEVPCSCCVTASYCGRRPLSSSSSITPTAHASTANGFARQLTPIIRNQGEISPYVYDKGHILNAEVFKFEQTRKLIEWRHWHCVLCCERHAILCSSRIACVSVMLTCTRALLGRGIGGCHGRLMHSGHQKRVGGALQVPRNSKVAHRDPIAAGNVIIISYVKTTIVHQGAHT